MVVAFHCSPSRAQTAGEHASILVEAAADHLAWASDFSLTGPALTTGRLSTSDTASLVPGVDSARNGGVSSLPIIHGLGDDRIRTLVNGAPVAAACPMHMNPPLSYIDPTNVGRIDVYPGVTPVSLGGDNLGGAILVESAPPSFAPAEESFHHEGSVSSYYRSNAASIGGAVSIAMASPNISFRYDGSGTRAGDYRDGDGTRINASRFATSNQQFTAATRRGNHLLEMQAAVQYMPYEGFPNADMDLVENVGEFAKVRYKGGYAWGDLRITGYYDRIRHQMNGNAPDRFAPAPVDITSMGLMPTRERAQDFGYRVNADFAMSTRDTLRIGNELHVQTLDDRWPGAPIGMMFDYVNINDATRAQVGTFAEWQRQAYTLADGPFGVLRLDGRIGFVSGQNLSTHTGLYHMMPLNGAVALEHQQGNWSSALQLHVVDNKTAVDQTRLEPPTPGYGILDLRTAYEFGSVRLDCAITNLSGRQYEHPLGGTWQSALYSPNYRGVTFRPLPAAGRSFDIGVAVRF